MFRKLKELVFRDVENENETKKVSVILRLNAMVMCVYFLCLLPFAGYAWPVVLCFCSYVLAFYTTYLNKTKLAVAFSHVILLFWVVIAVVWWGWDCGVQHYVFVVLVLAYTVNYAILKWKIIIGIVTCVMRLGLYFYSNVNSPKHVLGEMESVVFQLANTIFIFIAISVILLVFTNDSQEMERKLVVYNEKLHKLASIDPLTGLLNRRSMKEYLEQREKDCKEGKVEKLSLAIGDIDFFKKVNDTYGHDGGDAVLKKVAALCKEEIGDRGVVSRWGGEEFLFAFSGKNGDEAWILLDELQNKIRKLEVLHNNEIIKVTMTLGLDEYDFRHGMEYSISEADRKLYRGKEEGRNRIVY